MFGLRIEEAKKPPEVLKALETRRQAELKNEPGMFARWEGAKGKYPEAVTILQEAYPLLKQARAEDLARNQVLTAGLQMIILNAERLIDPENPKA